MVAIELKTPLNRLCLTQPMTPTSVAGGFISSCIVWYLSIHSWVSYRSTIAIFLLYQFIKADVSRLNVR